MLKILNDIEKWSVGNTIFVSLSYSRTTVQRKKTRLKLKSLQKVEYLVNSIVVHMLCRVCSMLRIFNESEVAGRESSELRASKKYFRRLAQYIY